MASAFVRKPQFMGKPIMLNNQRIVQATTPCKARCEKSFYLGAKSECSGRGNFLFVMLRRLCKCNSLRTQQRMVEMSNTGDQQFVVRNGNVPGIACLQGHRLV